MNNPPDWLALLADQVATVVVAVDLLAPLACHYCQDGDLWELTLFASPTEIVGGSQDGRVCPSRFHLDVKGLLELFDEVDSAYWQAQGLGREDEVGPHFGIEGSYDGHRVWLRLPALPPKRFPVGRQALIHERAWEELW